MKLTLISKTAEVIGGVETYLRDLIPALMGAGHEISAWFEDGARSSPWGNDIPVFNNFETLSDWKPDLLFIHGVRSAKWESELLKRYPAVLFAHNYESTCISGLKRWTWPEVSSCKKTLGAACLAHYLVNGCGGRNPITMLSEYSRGVQHRDNLLRYRAVLTHSRWMLEEYKRHVGSVIPVHQLPFLIDENTLPAALGSAPQSVWRIGFLGRLQTIKGGGVLLQAAKFLQDLNRPVEIWFMGDGPQKAEWEKVAEKISFPRISIRFWNRSDDTKSFLSQIHLLAVPSLWPEPFGRVGVEAAACGVPAVAFDVGGIKEWLSHLKTGVVVPLGSDLPRAFAQGITTALEGGSYEKLCEEARRVLPYFSREAHLGALLPLLESYKSQR